MKCPASPLFHSILLLQVWSTHLTLLPQEFKLAIVEPGGEPGEEGDTLLEKEVEPGEPTILELHVLLTTEGLEPGPGPGGWQLSIAYAPCPGPGGSMRFWDTSDRGRMIPGNLADDCDFAKNMARGFEITRITDDDGDPGTPPILDIVDLEDVGFNSTFCGTGDYVNAPPELAGLRGIVSAIHISELGGPPSSLIPNHRDVILELLIQMPPVASGEEKECRIFFVDGLRGPGTPLFNVVTYRSANALPTAQQGLILRVRGAPRKSNFVRGDSNDDGNIDISDAIRIIQDPRVIAGSEEHKILCMDAADVNDDLALTLADAIYLINWQFQLAPGFPPPPLPFPICGTVVTSTMETCPPGSVDHCP